MKIPKLKKYDAVRVKWLDSYAPEGSWHDEGEIDTSHGVEIESVGYYLEKSQDWLAVCMGYHSGGIHDLFYIPLGCIREIIKL